LNSIAFCFSIVGDRYRVCLLRTRMTPIKITVMVKPFPILLVFLDMAAGDLQAFCT
jgi:hypothetical protein